MNKGLFLLAVFLCQIILVASQPAATLPGFQGILTQNGLNYASTVALQILEQKLAKITIPDQSGDQDTITWQITDIVVTNLKIPTASIKIDSTIGLVVGITGVSADMSANWHGREDIWPHPSGSGQATAQFTDVTIVAEIAIYNSGGRLTLSSKQVYTNIGTLDLHFSGSNLDFILNLLKDLFNNAIKDAVQNEISNQVNDQIDTTLNNEIKTLPLEVVIGDVAELDYALVANPIFASSWIDFPLKGEFYDLVNPVEAPFTPSVLPQNPGTGEMLQAYIGDYVPNSASYAFWRAGKMNLLINNKLVPPDSPITLNTSTWQGIVPPLYTKYPNWLMVASVAPTQTPTVSFSATSGADAFGVGAIDMYVVSPTNGSLIPVFVLGMNVTADATVSVRQQNVTGNLTYIASNVWLEKSYIGTFNPNVLESIVKFLTLGVILPYFNYYLQTGIPIPSVDGVEFVNPSISIGNRYLFVSTNIVYTKA